MGSLQPFWYSTSVYRMYTHIWEYYLGIAFSIDVPFCDVGAVYKSFDLRAKLLTDYRCHRINSLQLSSSEESAQSKTPSHRAHGRTHSTPSAHRKSVDAQYADKQTSVQLAGHIKLTHYTVSLCPSVCPLQASKSETETVESSNSLGPLMFP